MSKIVVLVGSKRENGNTDRLAKAFARGASQHHEVEILSVAQYEVKPCIGCNACRSRQAHDCFQKDDMQVVYEKLAQADVIVVASPVYFYGLSAQLKAIIDRLHAPIRNTFKVKKLALLLVAADTIPNVFDAIKSQYQLVLDYFKLEDGGMVLVGGVESKGAIADHPALNEAFELGASMN